jgi:siroheme synthase-like protein
MKEIQEQHKGKDTNRLFPIFLKLESLPILIVGGGNVGLEKLQAILNNAPETRVTLVALQIQQPIFELSQRFPNIRLLEREFRPEDAAEAELAILAVNDPQESIRIRDLIKRKGLLVNVADQPELCDFYLSSIVQKGNLKIAISTNGKSPTIAKRLKEWLNEVLPDELDELLDYMNQIRARLKGDFAEKVRRLNAITKDLLSGSEKNSGTGP